MIEALFQYTFLQNAVAGALLASIACGVIGTFIMEKKLVMMSGGPVSTSDRRTDHAFSRGLG